MPGDPIDKASGEPSPEDRLKELFERIEREEAAGTQAPMPELPSNDEIGAGSFTSPIETQASPADPLHRPESADEVRLREIEKEFEETKALHDERASEINDEFGKKMKDLENRLNSIRQQGEGSRATELRQSQMTAADARGLGIGLSIAYTFIGMPLIGALVGWALDRALKTTFLLGTCTILGVVGGLAYMIVLMNRSNKQQ